MSNFKANDSTVALHIAQKGFAFTVESDRIADKVTCEQCGNVTEIEYPSYLVVGYQISYNEYHVEFYESISYEDGLKIQAPKMESDITVEDGSEVPTKEELEVMLLQMLQIISNYS